MILRSLSEAPSWPDALWNVFKLTQKVILSEPEILCEGFTSVSAQLENIQVIAL